MTTSKKILVVGGDVHVPNASMLTQDDYEVEYVDEISDVKGREANVIIIDDPLCKPDSKPVDGFFEKWLKNRPFGRFVRIVEQQQERAKIQRHLENKGPQPKGRKGKTKRW